MSDSNLDAGGKPAGEPRRKSAKAPVTAKKPDDKIARLQLHIGESVVQRLGVHCSLVGKNQSKEAGRILEQYLAQYGRGRELFDSVAPDSE
jgi:hypothetical protein